MPPLETSLQRLLSAMPDRDDWWLIGSAAAYLSGIDLKPQDVDLFGGRSTIMTLLDALGETPGGGKGDGLFRSDPFHRVEVDNGLDIEVMADLTVRGEPLILHTRVAIETAFGPVFVPSLQEQVRVFELFGRPKDLTKAAAIRVLKS